MYIIYIFYNILYITVLQNTCHNDNYTYMSVLNKQNIYTRTITGCGDISSGFASR
jgi:hypothetical protein